MLVSVILPVYNCEKYISYAIESILNQTYVDLELIIVDDASSDSSIQKILKFKDNRISLIRHSKNQGISKALNAGIASSSGKYVIRMDADDIAFPKRVEVLVSYMEQHPYIDVLGSAAINIDANNVIFGFRKCLTNPKPINGFSFTWFIHPTIIFKRTWVDMNLYNSQFDGAEDYELWLRAYKNSIYRNIDDFLLFYRDVNSLEKKTYLFRNNKMIKAIVFNHSSLTILEFAHLYIVASIKSIIVSLLPSKIFKLLFKRKSIEFNLDKNIKEYKSILEKYATS